MLSICSKCPGWLLTFAYEPKFCSRCGSRIGRSVPILEYALILFLAVWIVLVAGGRGKFW